MTHISHQYHINFISGVQNPDRYKTVRTTILNKEMTKTKTKTKTLNGRTLEGGGQLVRIAIALSALTAQPVAISDIRGNRQKGGLKASHLASIQFLAKVSGSTVQGAELGSTQLAFYPPSLDGAGVPDAMPVEREYSIRLETPGSVFLVFQAVYPYLLRVGHVAGIEGPIRLNLTGGTNASLSPSVDYIEQVLGPNLKKLGLPALELHLHKRGWITGPRDLGTVSVFVHLASGATRNNGFPPINLNEYRRTQVTKIDITVLAPDDSLSRSEAGTLPLRKLIEEETVHSLQQRISDLPSSLFQTLTTPINIHTSEQTYHHTHVYILLVAHTSNGFRIGGDALLREIKTSRAKRKRNHRERGPSRDDPIPRIHALVQRCIDNFSRQLYDPALDRQKGRHVPCVDEHMRDQLVIFEALGGQEQECGHSSSDRAQIQREDERYWSLHTQTAQWVFGQFLTAPKD